MLSKTWVGIRKKKCICEFRKNTKQKATYGSAKLICIFKKKDFSLCHQLKNIILELGMEE